MKKLILLLIISLWSFESFSKVKHLNIKRAFVPYEIRELAKSNHGETTYLFENKAFIYLDSVLIDVQRLYISWKRVIGVTVFITVYIITL